MLTDPFESGFDLAVCPNAVVYFTREIKERLYWRFYGALRPGGVLFVRGTQIVPGAAEPGFEDMAIGFYRSSGMGY